MQEVQDGDFLVFPVVNKADATATETGRRRIGHGKREVERNGGIGGRATTRKHVPCRERGKRLIRDDGSEEGVIASNRDARRRHVPRRFLRFLELSQPFRRLAGPEFAGTEHRKPQNQKEDAILTRPIRPPTLRIGIWS